MLVFVSLLGSYLNVHALVEKLRSLQGTIGI
jgi:hypothetical protein